MDTIKILLSLTATMLAGALFWSYSQQKKESANAPKEELARIEQQLAALAQENKNLENEKRLRSLGIDILSQERAKAKMAENSVAQEKPGPTPSAAELAAAAEEAKKIAEMAEKEANKLKDEEEVVLQRVELEQKDKDFRSANRINQALVMGRVTNFIDDETNGSFVTFDLIMPENVKVGDVLAVRRNSGIAGYLKVTSIEGDDGVAEILPGLGKLIPEAKEELVFDPFR